MITEAFPTNQEVQGGVLSPLLFHIFLVEMAKKLASGNGGFITNHSKINSIFWADDIVLLCEDKNQLDRMIKMTWEYCESNE